MKLTKKAFTNFILSFLIICGLIFAFVNLVGMKFQGMIHRSHASEVSERILQSIHEEERFSCETMICIALEDKYLQDKSKDMSMVQELKQERMLVSKGDAQVIFVDEEDDLYIYSKGLSPIYNKRKSTLQNVDVNRWVKYPAEKMFAKKQRKGENPRLSYGYLENPEYLLQIQEEGLVSIQEKTYEKYEVTLRNTLKDHVDNEDSDIVFRKTLASHGVDVMEIQNEYPKAYDKMRECFRTDTERMHVWVDDAGKLAKIEKDYTFIYYLEMMDENSEKIYHNLGQYGSPDIVCVQEYTYPPTCKQIELPKEK